MSKTKMLSVERLGLIALAIVVGVFACIAIARSCQRPAPLPPPSATSQVESIAADSVTTDSVTKQKQPSSKSKAQNPKAKTQKPKNHRPKNQRPKPYRRHHLDEPTK